jgi:hypothetical protein
MPASALVPFLWIAAAFTLLAGIVGLLPRALVCRRLPLATMDESGWLFFRHWAVLVMLCGILLAWAAVSTPARPPVLLLVGGEKLAFALIVFRQRQTPLGRALRGGAVADFAAALVMLVSLVDWTGAS